MSEPSHPLQAVKKAVEKRDWQEVCRLISSIPVPGSSRKPESEFCLGDSDSDSCIIFKQSDLYWHNFSLQQNVPTVLQKLLERQLWDAVVEMMWPQQPAVERCVTVDEALTYTDCRNFCLHILPHCPDKDLFDVLSVILKRVTMSEFEHYALDRLNDSQVSSFLDHAVSRGKWKAVGALLNKRADNDQAEQIVKEALRRASEEDFFQYISPHCSADQLDTVLTQIVTLGQWEAVGKLLRRPVSEKKRKWAVQTAGIECEENIFITHILPHCPVDQLDTVLRDLVLRDHWKSVGRLLERGVSDALRAWAIEEARKFSQAHIFVEYILPHCSNLKLNIAGFLGTVVTDEKWQLLGKVLGWGVNKVQMKWIARQVGTFLGKKIYSICNPDDCEKLEYLLSELTHCPADFADCLLSELLTSKNWTQNIIKAVGYLLKTSTNTALQKLAIENICKSETKLGQIELQNLHMAVKGSDDLKEFLLLQFVKCRLYEAAANELDVRKHCRKEAAAEALKTFWAAADTDVHFSDTAAMFLANVCSDEQMKPVLTLLVKKRKYVVLGQILEKGILSNENSVWVMQEVFKYGEPQSIAEYFLPYADRQMKEFALEHMVALEVWQMVGEILKRGIEDAMRRFAVERASKQAGVRNYLDHILPYVMDEDIDIVLPHLVRRGVWDAVVKHLQKHPSSSLYQWVVEEARKHASISIYLHCIMIFPSKHDNDQVLSDVIAKIQENMIQSNYLRVEWREVAQLIGQCSSDAVRFHAIENATWDISCDELFVEHIAPHFRVSDNLESVFKILLQRSMWRSVGKIMELNNASQNFCQQAVDAFLRKPGVESKDEEFAASIVEHISDKHADNLMQFVSTHRWYSVCKMLEKGNGGEVYDKAVLALLACSKLQLFMEKFTTHILPHCTERQLGVLLLQMADQKRWELVQVILDRCSGTLCTAECRRVIEDASDHADDKVFAAKIVPHCSTEQLPSVLNKALDRKMWKTVCSILQRNVRNPLTAFAVEQASESVADVMFATEILPLCSDDHLEWIIPHTIQRKMWKSLGVILQRGVSKAVHQRAIENAVEQAALQLKDQPVVISPGETMYYTDHHYQQQHKTFMKSVLPCCSDDQLDSLLLKAISLCYRRVATKIFQRGVSDSMHRQCVTSICKRAEETTIVSNVLPFCKDDEVDSIIQILTTRKHWQAVSLLLQRKVDKRHVIENATVLVKNCSRSSNILSILKKCSDEQKEDLVHYFVAEGHWELVGKILRLGIRQEVYRDVLHRAVTHLGLTSDTILQYILPHCDQEQLDAVFVHCFNDQHAAGLQKVLQFDVSQSKLRWATKQVIDSQCDSQVLLCFSNEALEAILSEHLTNVFFSVSESVLMHILRFADCLETRGKIIRMMIMMIKPPYTYNAHHSMHSIGLDLYVKIFLQECSRDVREEIVSLFVDKGMWEHVERAFQYGVSDTCRTQALNKATPDVVINFLSCHVTDDEIDSASRNLEGSMYYHSWPEIMQVFGKCKASTKRLIFEKALSQKRLEKCITFIHMLEGDGDRKLQQECTEQLLPIIKNIGEERERRRTVPHYPPHIPLLSVNMLILIIFKLFFFKLQLAVLITIRSVRGCALSREITNGQ